MQIVIKIVVTILFFLFWGGLARGCQAGTTGPMRGLMSIFTLVLLGAGLFGIWKFNPSSPKIDEDQKLRKD